MARGWVHVGRFFFYPGPEMKALRIAARLRKYKVGLNPKAVHRFLTNGMTLPNILQIHCQSRQQILHTPPMALCDPRIAVEVTPRLGRDVLFRSNAFLFAMRWPIAILSNAYFRT